MIRHPPSSTLFPYTPLFRSEEGPLLPAGARGVGGLGLAARALEVPGHDGVQGPVVARDPHHVELEQLDRRDLTAGERAQHAPSGPERGEFRRRHRPVAPARIVAWESAAG